MNIESDPGIQMIWAETEFVLHAFFFLFLKRDAEKKTISN